MKLRDLIKLWRDLANEFEEAPVGMTPGAVLAGTADGLRIAARQLEETLDSELYKVMNNDD